MAFDDPGALDLAALFRDARMFRSREDWAAAGFTVVNRVNSGRIMVARHPAARGLLFKRYTSDVSESDQTRNFERRVEGSRRLRAFVADRRLDRVVVAQKWLLELPRKRFDRGAHILAVEQFDLMPEDRVQATYKAIDPSVLRDLCVVLFNFRGMDSNVKNLPFVADGRVAFVDTEHWDRNSSKSYLHHIEGYLSRDRKKLAARIFDQLADGGDARHVSLARDFDDEEDTSSSSSYSSSGYASSS